ncbi:MAG TPA: hypothetical protein PLX05_12085 [Acinetobacter parvus]|uniref:hypothetical protein n=1 Tax=Acinetobacter parvus TaxID=134533 RepID=UPI002CB6BDD0|nr:hypothetical protein [Acinetobacter parvus]HRM16315.1 hypothetical protein [Acinetobacter parvus]
MDIKFKKYMNPRYIICAMIDSNYIDLHSLIEWADTMINSIDVPKDWLFLISLGSDINNVNYDIRCCLSNENILDHEIIDSLFIGFSYIRYKNGEVNINELDKILSGYFVFNKNLFNEDDLYTYFYHPKSNPNLINSINSEFVRCECISKKAIEYFYSNKVINEI